MADHGLGRPKMPDSLLKLDEAASVLRLRSGEAFSRFAERHGIPLIRFGRKVVRVRRSDLEHAIRAHRDAIENQRVDGEASS